MILKEKKLMNIYNVNNFYSFSIIFFFSFYSSSIVRVISFLLLPLLLGNDCNALQHQILDSYNNAEDCALILDGPGRTSVYDYTYNLLRGGL